MEQRAASWELTDSMRRELAYPKFVGQTRMLVLETDYFFDKSWARAAEELGWRTATASPLRPEYPVEAQLTALARGLAEFKPDFVVSSNYSGMDEAGYLARFFEDARIPHVNWFADSPRMILYGRHMALSHFAVAASWERAYMEYLRALGFRHVIYMPLATDPHLFNAQPAEQFERKLAFVGRSMIGHAQEAKDVLEGSPVLAGNIRAAFDVGRVTRDEFAQGLQAVLGPACLENRTPDELRHAELCLIYEATCRQRSAMAQRLDLLGLEVRGDAHWGQIIDRSHGDVAYFHELADYYRSTAINLNSTSIQMNSAVNQRVFDCPAAGGFLITDAQTDIETFFDPDSEVVTYHNLVELEDKVRYYRTRPAERLAITRRARKRILAHHTHKHRLRRLRAFLVKRFASRQRRKG
jgi:spore maturation protein CgeB